MADTPPPITTSSRPARPAFSSYFERDALRSGRARARRRMVLISVVVHGALLAGLLVYALWQVDELWAPPVNVKIFSPAQVPAEVRTSVTPGARR